MARTIIIYTAVILAFLALYFFANYYIYLKLGKILKIDKTILIPILVILAISFIVLSFVIRKFDITLIKGLYFISASWIGVFFFLLIGFGLADLIILISKVDYKIPYYIVIILVTLISAFSLINASNFQVKKIELKADISEDIKIVQISDVHLGPIHSKDYLQKIVNKSNSLNPDFVFITGDLFDGSATISEETVSPLKKLKAKYGIYFVTGNHETYVNEDEAINLISSGNIIILKNKVVNVRDIEIIGAEYPKEEAEKTNPFLNNLSSIVNKDKFSILLYHPPVGFEKAASSGINLQLSGHTHNGQIFPFNLISKIFYKHISGLYSINNSYLYVSPGTGIWGPPMRFLSKSEITEIILKAR